MTRRGDATRERLLEATRDVVREVGYAHATTRAIAAEADVSEGTIYRHFPDKRAMFFAAVLDGSQAIVDDLAELPDRAGQGSVADNLVWALLRLATLRQDVVPLELALATDPQMGAGEAAPMPDLGAGVDGGLPGPPAYLEQYLAAEQDLGRVRSSVDTRLASVALLTMLFGLSVRNPGPDGIDQALLAGMVETVVAGLVD
jgi:AcrR family transcriptional regulator